MPLHDYDSELSAAIIANNRPLVERILHDYHSENGYFNTRTPDEQFDFDINTHNLSNGFLDNHAYPIPPLALAIRTGAYEAAQVILSNGADINDDSGPITPLQAAAIRHDLSCVNQLIEMGANPAIVTPLVPFTPYEILQIHTVFINIASFIVGSLFMHSLSPYSDLK